MAELRHSTPAPNENTDHATFDALDWLTRFRLVGGWWIVTPDGKGSLGWMIRSGNRVSIGVPLEDTQIPRHRQARDMFDDACANQDIGTALRAHLIQIDGGDHGRD